MDDILLEVCFELLADYVETSLIPNTTHEAVMQIAEDVFEDDEDAEITDDQAAAIFHCEAFDLYTWWMVERPKREEILDKIENRIPNTPDGWKEDWMDDPKHSNTLNYKQYQRWLAEYTSLITTWKDEDELYFNQLLDIRHMLWIDDDCDDISEPVDVSTIHVLDEIVVLEK